MAMQVGDVWEVRVFCWHAAQVGINVFHYEVFTVGGDTSTLDAPEVAAAAAGLFALPYKNVLASLAEYVGVSARQLLPTLGLEIMDRTGAGFGSTAGDVLPGQVSGIITKYTALPGKRRRGRAYIPFPSEGDSDQAGIPNSGYMSRLQALGNLFDNFLSISSVTPAGTARLDPVVRSSLASPANAFITAGLARQKWATQRRRGNYGPTNPKP